MKAQRLNRRQACWMLYLSRFDFTLKHVLDTKIRKTDGLSRRSYWKIGIENNKNNQNLIREEWVQEITVLYWKILFCKNIHL